jgi:hypothetical protein
MRHSLSITCIVSVFPWFANLILPLYRAVLDIAIESGVIYENVARHVTRRVVRPRELDLPGNGKLTEFIRWTK